MSDNQLVTALRSYGAQYALHTNKRSYSYNQLCEGVEQQATRLLEAGVGRGDTVFLQGNYTMEGIAMFMALHQNGNIVAMNTADNTREIRDKMDTARAEFLVDLRSGTLERVGVAAGTSGGLVEELRRRGSSGLILFSSGTTGKPKAMLHDLGKLVATYARRRSRKLTMLLFLLFDHIGGINTLLNILTMGAAAAVPSELTPDHVAELIQRFEVSVLPTSPTFLNLLLLSGAAERHDLSALRLITYGTEPMPDALLARVRARLPHVKLLQTFGTSETGIVNTTSRSSDSLFMKFNDSSIEHKVVEGELWLRSERRMLGYLNHESDALTDDGWFRTGDAVEESSDGHLRILGRRKEVINVGGQKVFPSEVESVLMRHPKVVDCKVYGEANGVTGQFVAADVVVAADCQDSSALAVREIRVFARQQLDAFKVPVRLNVVEGVAYSHRFKRVLR